MREERNNGEIRGGEEQEGQRAADVLPCYPGGFKQSSQTYTHVAMVTEPQVCPLQKVNNLNNKSVKPGQSVSCGLRFLVFNILISRI